MRAKAIDSLGALANKFVHFNGNDILLFIKDLVNSGKWQLTFGNERNLLFQAMNTRSRVQQLQGQGHKQRNQEKCC